MSDQVLDKPAKVGAGTFGVGVKWSTVISAAQRQYDYAHDVELESSPDDFTRNFTAGLLDANKILHEHIAYLEQQLKTARKQAISECGSHIMQGLLSKQVNAHEFEEYANSLEGK